MKWRIYLVNGAYGGEEDQFPTMRPLRLIPILETLHNCWQADKDLFFNPKPSRSVLPFHSCQMEAVWKEIKQLYLMIWVHLDHKRMLQMDCIQSQTKQLQIGKSYLPRTIIRLRTAMKLNSSWKVTFLIFQKRVYTFEADGSREDRTGVCALRAE